MFTRSVRTPMHAAIWRFCMTARMSKPSGVFVRSRWVPKMIGTAKAMTKSAIPAEDDVEDGPVTAESQAGRIDLHVVRAEGEAEELLQNERDAPGGEERFQRAAVKEADDAALQGDADQRRHDEAKRQRDEEVGIERRPASSYRRSARSAAAEKAGLHDDARGEECPARHRSV